MTWEHVRRSATAIANVVHDLNYAQRQATIKRLSTDFYVFKPAQTAQTFGEFLALTAGPLAHEPSARARSLGRPVS